MNIKSTRATKDLKQTSIDSLLLPLNKEKQQLLTMTDSAQVNIDFTSITTKLNEYDKIHTEPTTYMPGHDLHDQRLAQSQQNQQSPIQLQLNSIQKLLQFYQN